jgi:hypothetical protein
MLVDHNNEITAEEAGAYKEVRHTSESLRAGSAGSELQYQLPVDNGNGYRAGPIQAHPHQNQQFFMNANQTSVHAMQQPAAYPVANYTGNPQHPMAPQQMWNGAQAVDLNNPQQLVQLLEARTSDNRVLHQHIVELQQQLEGMTLERDRYAAAYTQLRQRYGDN